MTILAWLRKITGTGGLMNGTAEAVKKCREETARRSDAMREIRQKCKTLRTETARLRERSSSGAKLDAGFGALPE